MADFDWVEALSRCSLTAAFQQLKLEVQADVESRNARRGPAPSYVFDLVSKPDRFAVLLSGDQVEPKSVVFRLAARTIEVYDDEDRLILSATLTLNDAGECRFRVGGEEKEFWQVRRMALEQLMFGIVVPTAG